MIVAVIMVALLGVGAMVIDLGALYVEKRQLQNGADAAALAVAQDCAGGDCGDEVATSRQYADLNSNDGQSAVDLVCGKGAGLTPCVAPAPAGAANATGWVRVVTSTKTASGTEVDFVLAPVMDSLAGSTVHAGAVAAWGALGTYRTIRFIISECEFQQMGGNLATQTFPTGVSYIYSKKGTAKDDKNNDPPCTSSSSGGTVAGNFAWLDADAGDICRATVTAGMIVGGNPGNDPEISKKDCAAVFAAMKAGEEFVMPIFNQVVGTGQSAQYTVAGFIGFRFTGWQLSGNSWPAGFSCPDPYTGQPGGGDLRCFRGTFTRVVSDGGGFGGIDYGARVVKMVG
ncbi:MAG: hypothetical protein HY828_16680 [Actinobacteria bacterium]|nr:hypothetical protein [Actinomycetota bacterium]